MTTIKVNPGEEANQSRPDMVMFRSSTKIDFSATQSSSSEEPQQLPEDVASVVTGQYEAMHTTPFPSHLILHDILYRSSEPTTVVSGTTASNPDHYLPLAGADKALENVRFRLLSGFSSSPPVAAAAGANTRNCPAKYVYVLFFSPTLASFTTTDTTTASSLIREWFHNHLLPDMSSLPGYRCTKSYHWTRSVTTPNLISGSDLFWAQPCEHLAINEFDNGEGNGDLTPEVFQHLWVKEGWRQIKGNLTGVESTLFKLSGP